MPPFEIFRDAADHVPVLGHKAMHWTAPPHGLNRDSGRDSNIAANGREELIAEFGSFFHCADLGIVPEIEPRSCAISRRLTQVPGR